LAVGLLAGAVVPVVCVAVFSAPPPLTPQDADRVHVGMTRAEVDQVLPRRLKESDGHAVFDRWSNGECMIVVHYDENDRVTSAAGYEFPPRPFWERMGERLGLDL
jgi:hypothetical protein